MIKTGLDNKQAGQTLVVIVMLMIISLGVGVAISTRFIKGLSMLSKTDNSARALAVAEAAAERILLLPNDTLKGYIQNNNCTTDCNLEIVGADGVKANAAVTLSFVGNSPSAYNLYARTVSSGQVSLSGYTSDQPVYICWNDDNMSIYTTYVYKDGDKYEADSYAYNSAMTSHSENNFSIAVGAYGYANCFTVNARKTPIMLRIKSVYADGDVFVLPSVGHNLPIQGISIVSRGKVLEEVRTVTVVKSDPILPSIFDYTLYQKSPSEPLSY